jgi:dCMP deaminase
MKRQDYINWEQYFMGIALMSAQRSKDNSTQVGACIVSPQNKILSVGYNGMPNGCCDDDMPWERSAESQLDTKYPYVCHAELNAILNGATRDYTDCTLYVTLFPCNECTKAVIQSGIKKIVYLDNKYADTDSVKASVFMLEKCGIEFVQYKPIGRTLMFEV